MTSIDSHRPGVTNCVHVGLVVEDLDERVRFLALLGFACGEPGVFGGEWIDRIIGLENVTVEMVAFKVDDVRAVGDRVREAGGETVGEIVDYENTSLLCYVRGPEGLIVELAERIDGAPG